jgi:hypothetical protein
MQNKRMFYVIDVDTAREVVEVQHLDGTIEEISFGEWVDFDLELCAPPENWSGPLDRVEMEDLDDGESAARKPPSRPERSGNR